MSDTDPKAAEKAVLGCLAFIGGMLGSLVITTPLRMYTLRKLWEWFAVTDFGMRPLTWHAALGVSAIVGFLTYQLTPKDAKYGIGYTLSMSAALSLMYLAFGYLYHIVTRGWS